MALRRTAAGMLEAGKGFRPINAQRQMPLLKKALFAQRKNRPLDQIKDAA